MTSNSRRVIGSLIALLVGLVVFTVTIVGLGASGGAKVDQQSTTALKPIPAWTDELIIQNDELPYGWKVDGSVTENKFGTKIWRYWFRHVSVQEFTWVNFSEQIAIYSTVETTLEMFDDWGDLIFPPGADTWEQIPELEFSHHASQMKTACIRIFIDQLPVLSCSTVARYQNVVLVVRGNVFEDQWLTLSDFRNVLEAIDARLVKVLSRNTLAFHILEADRLDQAFD